MPIELYRNLSDSDAAAIVAWLRSVPPVRNAVTAQSHYDTPPHAFGPPVRDVAEPPRQGAGHGAYLAALAHCLQCHSPRLGADAIDWRHAGAGGRVFQGPWGAAVSHNLTANRDQGLGEWSDARIVTTLTTGVSADGRKLAPPMAARAPIFARWTPADMADLVAWLRSLPPRDTPAP